MAHNVIEANAEASKTRFWAQIPVDNWGRVGKYAHLDLGKLIFPTCSRKAF